MATTTESRPERKRRHWRWSAYLTGGFFLLLASIPPADTRDEGVAYSLGYVLGTVAVIFGIALVLRAVYAKLIRRDGRPIWSPWVFVIVAVMSFLVLAGRLGDQGS